MKTLKEHNEIMTIQNLLNLNLIQSEIAVLVAKGLSNKEIGNQLFMTEMVVKNHINTIYQNTGMTSRAKLIIKCLPYLGFILEEAK